MRAGAALYSPAAVQADGAVDLLTDRGAAALAGRVHGGRDRAVDTRMTASHGIAGLRVQYNRAPWCWSVALCEPTTNTLYGNRCERVGLFGKAGHTFFVRYPGGLI